MAGGSYSDIAFAALGLPGRYVLDSFLSIMLYGFMIASAYFTIINLKNVADGIFDHEVPEYYLGKALSLSHNVRHLCFLGHNSAHLCSQNRETSIHLCNR